MKRLIVAEKQSVGIEIAKVLNCRQRANEAIIGEHDIVTWAKGHLIEECLPDEMDDKYKEWRMEDLPIIPNPFQFKVRKDAEKQFQVIKSYMNDPEVDRIVCATDAGREGELIFRYIYLMAGCDKPVDRLWISSLTYSAIKSGFENLKSSSEYDNLYESARCRSEADWLVGINGSRAFAIASDVRGVSVGRVLSPTLAILVQREIERREFIPEKYCELIVDHGGFEGRLINQAKDEDPESWSRFPMADKASLRQFVATKPAKAKVVLSENEAERISAPQLYDLTSLQRDANRMFSFSAKRTLDIAQNLYEARKAISYPRTDSRYLSSDIKSTLNQRLQKLCFGEWEAAAQKALQSEKDLFGRFIFNKGVSDHHAIIPTGEIKDINTWSKGERAIFNLIVGRFIGMFLPDKEVLHQKMITAIGTQKFLSFGGKVLKEGWAEADKSRKTSLNDLPNLEEGDAVAIKNMRVNTDETEPPAPHTEASLLNAMEHAGVIVDEETEDVHETEFGIGTPATRASIIEKILEKQMAFRKGRALFPSEYGIKMIEDLPDYLRSPKMTGEWEARLSRISKGNEDPDSFMTDIKELTHDLMKFVETNGTPGLKDAYYVGKCPLCGQYVREYADAYYCVNHYCQFRRIWKAKKGFHPTLKPDTMRQLLKEGRAETEKGIYTLIETAPYIAYVKKEDPSPQFDKLQELIIEYGLQPVDKVPKGGALWFEGQKGQKSMEDFVSDCDKIGCTLQYAKASKALKHKSGWYLKVNEKYIDDYMKVFNPPNNQFIKR